MRTASSMSLKPAPSSHEQIYAFVVDAGSSGNRLLLYTPEDMFPQGIDVMLDVSDVELEGRGAIDLDDEDAHSDDGGGWSNDQDIYAFTKRTQNTLGILAVTMEHIVAIEAGIAYKPRIRARTEPCYSPNESRRFTHRGNPSPGSLPDWLPRRLRQKGELLRRFADALVKAIFDHAASSEVGTLSILSVEVLATTGVRSLQSQHPELDLNAVVDDISMTINRAFSKMLSEHPRNAGEFPKIKGTSRGMRIISQEEEHELEAVAVERAAALAQLGEIAGVLSMAGKSITLTAFGGEYGATGRHTTRIDYGFKVAMDDLEDGPEFLKINLCAKIREGITESGADRERMGSGLWIGISSFFWIARGIGLEEGEIYETEQIMNALDRAMAKEFPEDSENAQRDLVQLLITQCIMQEIFNKNVSFYFRRQWMTSQGKPLTVKWATAAAMLAQPALKALLEPPTTTTSHEKGDFWETVGHLGHPLRGLSSQYLSTVLLAEVAEKCDIAVSDAKVHHIEKSVIRGKGKGVWCPRDSRMGAAYVDCVHGKDNVGLSDFMLSYTWGYKVVDIANTLRAFCHRKSLAPNRMYIWVCCLCINQHRVQERRSKGEFVPFSEFQKEFTERVTGLKRVVAMMSPWRAPQYLQRVWCNFEMYTAIMEKLVVDIAMPPDQDADFMKALQDGTGLDDVWVTLSSVQIQNADASVAADKEQILDQMRKRPGFDILNDAVTSCLQNWIVRTAELGLEDRLGPEFQSPRVNKGDAEMCSQVARLCLKLGKLDRAGQILYSAYDIRKKTGTLENYEGALLIRHMANVEKKRGQLDSSLGHLEEAKAIMQQSGTLNTDEGVKLVLMIAGIRRRQGQLDLALRDYVEAEKVYEKMGQLQGMAGLKLLLTIADVKFVTGDRAGSHETFLAAKGIMESISVPDGPAGADVLRRMGNLRYQVAGDKEAALKDYIEAYRMCHTTGTLETIDGAALIADMSYLRRHADLDEAIQGYEQAYAIHERTGTLQTYEGGQLMMRIATARLRQGKLQEALEKYDVAKAIFQQTGSLETPAGAILLTNVAGMYRQLGKFDAALENYESARIVLEKKGMGHSEEVARLGNAVKETKLAADLTNLLKISGKGDGRIRMTDFLHLWSLLGINEASAQQVLDEFQKRSWASDDGSGLVVWDEFVAWIFWPTLC